MAYDDDYEDEDYYEPEETFSDSDEGWQPPEPEFEPEPEEEEPFPLPRERPSAEEQAADEAENAPPYQVAGASQPPPKDEGYVTDPGLLEQLGEPPKKAGTKDEGYVTDPELLKQLGTPISRYVEQEGKEPEPRSVIQRAIEAPGEAISGLWDSVTRLIDPPTKEEAEKYLGPSGILRSAQETGSSLLDILFGVPTAMLAPLQSAIASGMAKITPGDKTDEEKYQEWMDKVGTALMGMGSRAPAVPRAYTGAGTPGRYPLGTPEPELPIRGGATRTPQQPPLPLEPPAGEQFRPPQPELPLRTPIGEQGQLPLPGEAGPRPAGRVAPGGELVTPPAPELPGPRGRIETQTEMPLLPPTERTVAPREPVRQGELLPPTGEQGQLPFPHEAAPTAAGRTQRHGSPGAEAAAGTAEAKAPPPTPRPGEPGWLTQARGPEDYGKETRPRGAGGGMNVGDIDPTLRDAATPRTVPGEAAPQAAATAARPAEAVRGPIPEIPGGAQKGGGNIVRPAEPMHLDQRPTGELIRLARQGGMSDFMRQSLSNELERRGIRRMPEPARAEPPDVGAQLRAREEAARRATQEATAPGPARQFLQDERGGGRFSLKKDDAATTAREDKYGGSRPVYSIHDVGGGKIGEVRLSRPLEHQLVIDDIKATGGSYSGSLRKGMPLGPDVLKSFLRQIPKEFPGVTMVGGSRVSGARGVAGTDRRVFRRLSDLLADERGGGRLPIRQPLARITPQEMVRREPIERGRSGRPITTEPLPIGTERAILERGAEKATGPKLPPEQAPPLRQPAERQGPKLTSYERAKKMTSEQLREELARPDIPRVQRAVFNDVLRGRGEKPPEAPTGKPPVSGGTPPLTGKPAAGKPAAPLPEKAGLAERAQKAGISEARQAVRDHIAPNPSWTDRMPKNLREAVELIHRGYEGVFNANHPMARTVAHAERELGRKLETQEDFNRLSRAIKGLGGKLETIYREGPFDPETRKTIGPAFDPILRDIMKDRAAFTEYAVARRAIEQHGKGLKTGIPIDRANQTVAELGSRWGKTFKDYQEFKDSMLQMAKHLIGPENIAKIKELNKDHVPFYRALDPKSEMGDQFRTGGGLRVKDPIERYKGSERQIIDPLHSELKNMAMFADLAEKNEVWRAMERTNQALIKAGRDPLWEPIKSDQPLPMTSEQRTRMKEAGIPDEMVEKMRFLDAKQFAPESEKIRYYENGKEQIRAVNKDIGRVAAGMTPATWNLVNKIIGTPKRLLTAGATLNPDFPTKNLWRDQITAFIQHDAKLRDMLKGDTYLPFVDAGLSLQRFFKPDVAAEFNKWMRNGGANANLVSFDRKLLSMEPRSVAGKVKDVVTHPWQIPRVALDLLRGASEQLENASRFGGYLRDIKRGKDPETAAFRGRERTVDFQRMGNFAAIQWLSHVIPFFNPQLQGIDRYVRSYKTNPTATTVKTLAALTLPSVMLYMFNNRGDPRYEELPMWRKMLFWNVMTDKWRDVTPEMEKKLRVDAGNAWFRKDPATGKMQYNYGTIYSFPKPFIEGQLAGSLAERVMEAWLDHKKDAFRHVSDSLIEAVMPNYIPQFMVPTTEAAMNWSTFLKRPLMSESMEKKPQAQQFTSTTSETAKAIAGAVRTLAGEKPGMQLGSPIIIDNYIRQLTGGLGNYIVKGVDKAIDAATGREVPPAAERTMADMPIIKGFISRFPDRGAESIQKFYDLRKEGQTDKAGGNKNAWTGDETASRLKGYRDAIEKFNADKTMSPADKRTAIDVTTLMMIEAAKRGIELGNKANARQEEIRQRKQRGYAEGGEVEPEEPEELVERDWSHLYEEPPAESGMDKEFDPQLSDLERNPVEEDQADPTERRARAADMPDPPVTRNFSGEIDRYADLAANPVYEGKADRSMEQPTIRMDRESVISPNEWYHRYRRTTPAENVYRRGGPVRRQTGYYR